MNAIPLYNAFFARSTSMAGFYGKIKNIVRSGNRLQTAVCRDTYYRSTEVYLMKKLLSFFTVVGICSLCCAESVNLLPNPSFEDGTVIGDWEQYVTNDQPPYSTSAWVGGIITRGNTWPQNFCIATMADGSYGMALHALYPSTSAEFTVDNETTYTLSFKLIARNSDGRVTVGGMQLSVYIDDSDTPVATTTPLSGTEWRTAVFPLGTLTSGTHTVTFRGTLYPGVVDASVIIDDLSIADGPAACNGFHTVISGLPEGVSTDGLLLYNDQERVVPGTEFPIAAKRVYHDGKIYCVSDIAVTVNGSTTHISDETCILQPSATWSGMAQLTLSYSKKFAVSDSLIPNSSFEEDTVFDAGNYQVNDQFPYHTGSWQGGILTLGYGEFCYCGTVDGTYAMALHNATQGYRETGTDFTVTSSGEYELSFFISSRPNYQCAQMLSVYLDDGTDPVISVLPPSTMRWDPCVVKFPLKRGRHHLRFSGTLLSGCSDASTLIDCVVLRKPSEHNALTILFY